MKNKLTVCKACNKEIAKNAKTCPHCGAKTKKKHYLLIGIVVLIILACIIASSGDSDEPKKVDNPNANGTTSNNNTSKNNSNNNKTGFYVGETAELKGILVTLVDVSESTGSTYNKPAEGNVFVICEFEITNNSKEEITVSSMMSFAAYCDDYACSLSLGALIEKDDQTQLDGTVAAGKKLRGIIGYEVPANWKELEVRYTPDLWSEKEIVFVVNN